jgi:hypothetical protein
MPSETNRRPLRWFEGSGDRIAISRFAFYAFMRYIYAMDMENQVDNGLKDKPKAVWVEPETHRRLEHLASLDRRTIGGEADHLVEQEMVRRGLLPPIEYKGLLSQDDVKTPPATGQE